MSFRRLFAFIHILLYISRAGRRRTKSEKQRSKGKNQAYKLKFVTKKFSNLLKFIFSSRELKILKDSDLTFR